MKIYQVVFFFFIPLIAESQVETEFQIIRPVDDGRGENPLMELVSDTTQTYKIAKEAIDQSFMGQAVHLFHLAQNYKINTGQLDTREPAYLAITKNQGGFAKKGFRLKTAKGIENKSQAHYIDLTEGRLTSPLGKLMSITQLYPHELGHTMYRMMSSTDSLEQEGKSVTVHYFSLLTDNSIAFNEGFAEHLENIARIYEPNDSLKRAIEEDVEQKESSLMRSSKSFVRDFTWPLRMGFYKITMVVWYQQFEDYKRYKHALEGTVVFKNEYPDLSNVADMISIRNAGINQLASRRNKSQLMASEGFVSAYFSRLAVLGLGTIYRDTTFYKPFLADTTQSQLNPNLQFNEVENLFAKYFYVLDKYVSVETSEKTQMIDFIDGYQKEFPDEAPILEAAYMDLTGETYSNEYPPALWLMSKGYNHRILALDAYGAITIPIYTFNINAAEAIDLLTINGVDPKSAEAIVKFRNDVGFYESIDEVTQVPGITQEAITAIQSADFDEEMLEDLDLEDLNIGSLLSFPLLVLLKRLSVYFILFFLASYLIALRKSTKGGKLLLTLTKYYFLWLLLVIIALTVIVFPGNPVFEFLIIAIIYLVAGITILRKKENSLKHFLIISSLMVFILTYSLI